MNEALTPPEVPEPAIRERTAQSLGSFLPLSELVGTVDGITLGGGGANHEFDDPHARFRSNTAQPAPFQGLEPLPDETI